jgi:hypothetical protein
MINPFPISFFFSSFICEGPSGPSFNSMWGTGVRPTPLFYFFLFFSFSFLFFNFFSNFFFYYFHFFRPKNILLHFKDTKLTLINYLSKFHILIPTKYLGHYSHGLA